MTYRAVGSGTGQTEFIGEVSDFGSADIPLSSSQHSGLAGTVVQVPFQLGAVSFFHNVAADDLGVAGRFELDQLYVGEDLSKRHHDLGRCDDCRGEPELICPGWATDYDHPSIGRVEFDVRDYELFVRGVS